MNFTGENMGLFFEVIGIAACVLGLTAAIAVVCDFIEGWEDVRYKIFTEFPEKIDACSKEIAALEYQLDSRNENEHDTQDSEEDDTVENSIENAIASLGERVSMLEQYITFFVGNNFTAPDISDPEMDDVEIEE